MPLVSSNSLDSLDSLTVLQPSVRLGDPHACSDDRHRLSVLHALYEPLVRRAGHGRFVGALAESWTLSQDCRRWEFQLRPGVRFHDGQRLTADDVVASLARVRDHNIAGELATSGIYQGYLQGCQLEASAEHSVVLHLATPLADLLDVLVELFILPASSLAQLPQLPAGTGPFMLLQANNDEVTMAAHEAYWQGKPALKQLVWRAEAEAALRLEHLRTKQADIVSDAPALAKDAKLRHYSLPSSVTTTFMFNLLSGHVADVQLRRALNYATDNAAIVETLFQGDAYIMASPCTPPQLAYDPQLEPYPYDPQHAQQLLEASDLPDLRLTFDIPSRLPDEAQQLAALLQQQWQAVGLRLEVVEHPDRPRYAEAVREKHIHDAACFDSSPHSSFRLFQEKFRSDIPGAWWLGYDNAALNALLKRAQSSQQLETRQQHYRQAARMLRDDPPWLYLYSSKLSWATRQSLQAWQPSTDGLVTLHPHNIPQKGA